MKNVEDLWTTKYVLEMHFFNPYKMEQAMQIEGVIQLLQQPAIRSSLWKQPHTLYLLSLMVLLNHKNSLDFTLVLCIEANSNESNKNLMKRKLVFFALLIRFSFAVKRELEAEAAALVEKETALPAEVCSSWSMMYATISSDEQRSG